MNGRILLQSGWTGGPHFGKALKEATELEAQGWELSAILTEIEKYKPTLPEVLTLREEPVLLEEAIQPVTEADSQNLQAVRKCMQTFLKLPVVTKAAIMPDACPAGPGITVGGAISVTNAIIPAAHSADICCSMYLTFYKANKEFKVSHALDVIEDTTHFGPSKRTGACYKTNSGYTRKYVLLDHPVLHEAVLKTNPYLNGVQEIAKQCLGTNGDGNHFAYFGKVMFSKETLRELRECGHDLQVPADELLYAYVTHHGSRNFGARVYKEGQKTALRYRNLICPQAPDYAAWIPYETPDGLAYWEALQYIERWTKANHEVLHTEFQNQVRNLNHVGQVVFNAHNFVWKRENEFYHGKGATPAWLTEDSKPQLGIIPLNMAAPILITTGKDNATYLSFSPHGAGRNVSRTATLNKYKLEDAKKLIAGLDIRWASGLPDLTETPLGYKDADHVTNQITQLGLANVHAAIYPLGCVMAGALIAKQT